MKNILIATDFSENAANAGKYGYALASWLHSNVILINSFLTPEAVPQGNLIGWPLEGYTDMLEDSRHQLELYEQQLTDANATIIHKPEIACVSQMGELTEALARVGSRQDIGIFVLGTHHKNVFKTIIEGDHCRQLIGSAKKPLLIIPEGATYVPIKKIAFASDFKHPEDDLHAIYELIELARGLNAEILLTHVYDGPDTSTSNLGYMKEMLIDLSNKANYPYIYYRIIMQRDVEDGLAWLSEHGQIDMLAMVHHKHSLLDKIFTGSHSQKMAVNTSVPLLIFTEANK
jgi:nucleotide-binding universal stress UspA family protein